MAQAVTLKHMKVFLAVAQSGSFTRAGEILHLTQSTVTALIAQLEEALDVRLFDRTSRHVEPTGAGRDLLPRAHRLLGDFDGLVHDMRRYGTLEKGIVRVYSALSAMEYLVAPAVALFARQYPAVRVHLQDGMYRPILEAVLSGEVDFGITSHWTQTPGLSFEPLLKDQYGAFCSADDELASMDTPAEWRHLAGRKIVDYIDTTGSHAFLRQYNQIPSDVLSPFYEVSSVGCQVALVKYSLGVAILPALSAHQILTADTRFVVLHEPLIERNLSLVTRSDYALSPAAAALVRMVRQMSSRGVDMHGIGLPCTCAESVR